jgi:ADP-ribosylglycohydrolase
VSTRDRALGAFYGLALGDALGMPTQSMSRAEIARRYGPIAALRDAVADQPIAPGMPAGSITDDTEQAVLLARLLIRGGGRVVPEAFAKALLDWEADVARRGLSDLTRARAARQRHTCRGGGAHGNDERRGHADHAGRDRRRTGPWAAGRGGGRRQRDHA